MNEIYDLDRFVEAQNAEDAYQTALSEIKNGHKSTHWMWYIFPQLEILGFSYMAKFYGIKNIKEAQAYLEHPILGKRLREISKVLLNNKDKTAYEILGEIDELKLRSSMTLFDFISPNDVFSEVLSVFYNGIKDEKTCKFINESINNKSNLPPLVNNVQEQNNIPINNNRQIKQFDNVDKFNNNNMAIKNNNNKLLLPLLENRQQQNKNNRKRFQFKNFGKFNNRNNIAIRNDNRNVDYLKFLLSNMKKRKDLQLKGFKNLNNFNHFK